MGRVRAEQSCAPFQTGRVRVDDGDHPGAAGAKSALRERGSGADADDGKPKCR
jgi:hypothetical protein